MKNKMIIWFLACLFSYTGFIQEAAGQKREGRIKANGIDIAYESFGSEKGEAILLIQGIGVQLIGWPEQLCERLALQGYRVIRFDNRDVGLSSRLDSLGITNKLHRG